MIFWKQAHGALTHFPIALLLFALVCDTVAVVWAARRSEFRAASKYSLGLGALGSFAAVFSGIALSHGEIVGRGDLAWHHILVWPAFGLLIGLALWRWIVREPVPRNAWALYYGVLLVAAGCITAAAYFGGEVLLRGV